jgi:hypothetical protein
VAAAFISDADEEVVKAGWTVDVSEVRTNRGGMCDKREEIQRFLIGPVWSDPDQKWSLTRILNNSWRNSEKYCLQGLFGVWKSAFRTYLETCGA